MTSLFALSAAAQGLNARFLGYIDRYKEVAMEHCRSHGVPASITLAQGLLESNAGQSYLATRGNNHFGIKCHKWAGEAVEYDDTLKHDCYRKYGSPEDSFLDHARFLCGKRYQTLHQLDTTDYRGWANGLRTCGYAEDPAYPQKLVGIIERYNLHQYDSIAMIPLPKKAAAHHGKEHHPKHQAHDKSHADVPAPHKKSRHEPAAVPPRSSSAAPPQHKPRQGDEAVSSKKRRTTLEPQASQSTEKATGQPEPQKGKSATATSSKRLHNQRPQSTGKPLSGSTDNDD